MIVFKLERERPAYATHGGTLYYIKERYLRAYDYQSQRDNPLISIRRSTTAGGCHFLHMRFLCQLYVQTSTCADSQSRQACPAHPAPGWCRSFRALRQQAM